MPHGAVVAWRRAPALEPQSWRSVSRVRPIWAKTDLAEFCSKRNQARKNKRVPLMRFHIGFVVSKIPQHNELSQLPQSPSMSVGGARTRLGMGLNRAVLFEASPHRTCHGNVLTEARGLAWRLTTPTYNVRKRDRGARVPSGRAGGRPEQGTARGGGAGSPAGDGQ